MGRTYRRLVGNECSKVLDMWTEGRIKLDMLAYTCRVYKLSQRYSLSTLTKEKKITHSGDHNVTMSQLESNTMLLLLLTTSSLQHKNSSNGSQILLLLSSFLTQLLFTVNHKLRDSSKDNFLLS
ncbi:unnamed protein product, partial [Brassica rapa subsp. narinosa]